MRALSGWGAVVGTVVAALCVVVVMSGRDVRERRDQLRAEHRFAPSRSGAVEYIDWGRGPAVLVLHGAGGGFDQGRLIARAFGGSSFRWISLSRFGYLGSVLPADASTSAQADAIADLLNHLHLQKVSILAFSGGVPPALQFAERHPSQTACMALLSSAPFTPYRPPAETRPIPDSVYQALFGSDAVYWAIASTSRGTLLGAFDARPELRATLPRAEQEFLGQLVDAFLPASDRAAGVLNEAAAIDPGTRYSLQRIRTPTLIVHARDDRLNAFEVAREMSARISDSRFLPLDSGGHLLLGNHAYVRGEVSVFLRCMAERQ
jgi:2-hydroxy-6-oxonona-2,4-dienedioate hydrolase